MTEPIQKADSVKLSHAMRLTFAMQIAGYIAGNNANAYPDRVAMRAFEIVDAVVEESLK